MSDIVERLKQRALAIRAPGVSKRILKREDAALDDEAAAEIERLREAHEVTAAPDPTTDEALVERVARAICEAQGYDPALHWEGYVPDALAAIRAMEQKP